MDLSTELIDESILDEKWKIIEQRLAYSFNDQDLMLRAITRRDSNEKVLGVGSTMKGPLATLGDAVIKTIVLRRILKKYSTAGEVTEVSKNFISRDAQSRIARTAHLEDIFIWSLNEIKMKVWESKNPLGECLEALIGAIFLDSNDIDVCEKSLEKISFFIGL